MRRSKQQLEEDEAKQILQRATNGVLSLTDSNGHPYGVPMSYVYDGENYIYFHCAVAGRKINFINENPHCCFTVIDQDEIHPDEFTTYFRSVIAEGEILLLKETEQKIEALRLLSSKYSPGIDCETEIANGINRVLVLQMKIESLSGKEAIELTRKKSYLKTNLF